MPEKKKLLRMNQITQPPPLPPQKLNDPPLITSAFDILIKMNGNKLPDFNYLCNWLKYHLASFHLDGSKYKTTFETHRKNQQNEVINRNSQVHPSVFCRLCKCSFCIHLDNFGKALFILFYLFLALRTRSRQLRPRARASRIRKKTCL